MVPEKLSQIMIIFEGETVCRQRLIEQGLAPDAAEEVACYLSQATDLAAYYDRLQAVFQPQTVKLFLLEMLVMRKHSGSMTVLDGQDLQGWISDGLLRIGPIATEIAYIYQKPGEEVT